MNNDLMILLQTLGYMALLIVGYEFVFRSVKNSFFKTVIGSTLYSYVIFMVFYTTFKCNTSWYMIMLYSFFTSLINTMIVVSKLKDETSITSKNESILAEIELPTKPSTDGNAAAEEKVVNDVDDIFTGREGTVIYVNNDGQYIAVLDVVEKNDGTTLDEVEIMFISDDKLEINDRVRILGLKGFNIIGEKK